MRTRVLYEDEITLTECLKNVQDSLHIFSEVAHFHSIPIQTPLHFRKRRLDVLREVFKKKKVENSTTPLDPPPI